MISVIIPLYNKESIIERSLRSVLSQNYDDFEVVIVNDGSTDRSADIVRSIEDSRIRLINQENGGPSKARNTGVNKAEGEWIVFLDADDELLPNALNIFGNSIVKYKKADFIAAPFYNDNGAKRLLAFPYKELYINDAYKKHFFGNFLPRTGAFICKRELFINNPFNEGIRRFEDLESLFRIYKNAKIALISQPTMVVNTAFAEASYGRKNINEDFVGHLDFKGKPFWEKMCLYQLYLGERTLYPGQIYKLYPTLKYRYDLLLLYKIIKYFHAHC